MKVWLTTADDEFCRWLSGAANEKPKINGCLATGEDEFRSCVPVKLSCAFASLFPVTEFSPSSYCIFNLYLSVTSQLV